MAFIHSPKLVTNGLVLCLDAANKLSYPGSGTTWYDLSGNANNGTLTNGPTFNSANSGSIVFDYIDDYIKGECEVALQYYLRDEPYAGINNFNPVQISDLDSLGIVSHII